ncbi:MAG: hypothetical protein D6820_18815, partial [Lentisphaerae bacterium]
MQTTARRSVWKRVNNKYLITAMVWALACAAWTQQNCIENGSFSNGLQHWQRFGKPGFARIMQEGGRPFLRISSPGLLEQKIRLQPHWRTLKVSARMRCRDLVKGKKTWQTFRLALCFQNAAGKPVHYPQMPQLDEDSPDWVVKTVEISVPVDEGAQILSVQPALFGRQGVCDITDIQVVVVGEERQNGNDAPRGAMGVLVIPSVRRKLLQVRVWPLARTTDGKTKAKLAVLIRDAGGKTVLRQEGELRPLPDDPLTGELIVPWNGARYWHFDDPYRYRLEYELKHGNSVRRGQALFGFREFWIEGRRFMLNGQPIRLRPTKISTYHPDSEQAIREFVRRKRALGYNFVEIWPGKGMLNRYDRLNRLLGEICAQEGMGFAGALPHQRDFNNCDNDTDLKRFLHKVKEVIYTRGNSPALLMWNHSANCYINGRDQDPRLLGRKGWTNVQEEVARFTKGERLCHEIRRIDPSRPVFSHAGGPVGDVYNLNCYLNMIPLQEREEWLSQWAKDGEMPLLMAEFGTPLWTTMTRGRAEYGKVITQELFMTEWAAVYFGPKVYRTEPDWYLDLLNTKYQAPFRYEAWRFGKNAYQMLEHPGWKDLQRLFLRNTWRSWRTWGISGGMIPWFERDEWGDPLLTPYNRKFLAWIAGDTPAFTDKTHSFSSGGTVRKQLALLHDGDITKAVPYQARLTATCGGKEIWHQELKGQLQPG